MGQRGARTPVQDTPGPRPGGAPSLETGEREEWGFRTRSESAVIRKVDPAARYIGWDDTHT